MNMLMIAPLCDSRGKIRYFIGAQVDISGLIKDCTDLESLQQLVTQEQDEHHDLLDGQGIKDDFQDLSEMLNMAELETVRKYGGRMHREYQEDEGDVSRSGAPHMPRLMLQEPTADDSAGYNQLSRQSGRLSGIYQNVRTHWPIRWKPLTRLVSTNSTLPILSYTFCVANAESAWYSSVSLHGQDWWLLPRT